MRIVTCAKRSSSEPVLLPQRRPQLCDQCVQTCGKLRGGACGLAGPVLQALDFGTRGAGDPLQRTLQARKLGRLSLSPALPGIPDPSST